MVRRPPTWTLIVASVVAPPARDAGLVVVGDHPERLHLEPGLLPAGGAPHEELERRVRDLEVVALVLHPLQGVDEVVHLRPVEREPELLRLQR